MPGLRLRAFLLASLLLVAMPQPAAAADSVGVRAQLADAARAAQRTDQEIARLEQSMAERRLRIERERAQVRLLAKVLYQQPDSPLVIVAESSSLTDALSRTADLMVAGDRARASQLALQRDQDQMAVETARAEQARAQISVQRKQLESEYAVLVAEEAASRQAAAAAAAATAAKPAPSEPAPAPIVLPPLPGGSMQQLILAAWAPAGAAVAQWAVQLAQCESGLNPYAVNRSSSASGLFQFLPSTWAGTPYRAQSPFDPSANALAGLWLYQHYGAGQWSCSARVGYRW